VIVSTDDIKIANISRKYGAEAPFLRPKNLATDKSSVMDVISHVIEWTEKNNDPYDLIMLLQPTSPLRKTEDIDNAIKLLFAKRADAIVSVSEAEHHPYGSNTLPKNGCMSSFVRSQAAHKNRQDFPVFYRINGVVYLARCYSLKTRKQFFGKKTYAYVMPIERSVDIDSKLDFDFAEFCLKRVL